MTMATAVVASGLLLFGCSSGGSGGSTSSGSASGGANNNADPNAMIKELKIPAEGAAAAPGIYNFNPYAPKAMAANWVYEHVFVQNKQNCEIVPWLATGFEWTDPSTLVLTIREGVKWSDGQPFGPNDVVFSYQQAIKNPSMDRFGLAGDLYGEPLKSVSAKGNNVTLKFGGPAALKMEGVINTWIIPEHVYGKVGNIVEYIDKEPVTTGPFKVGSYNGRALVLERRPEYWQADQIKVEKLIMEGEYDANSAALKLQNGQLDAYWGDIQNPEKSFVAMNPATNAFYYAPGSVVALSMNNEKEPFTDVKVREAVAYGLNKEEMSLKGSYGIMSPASQSMLRMPFFQDLLPKEFAANDGVIQRDVEKAKKILEDAGYKADSNGMRTMPDGKPMAVTVQVQAGWLDYIAFVDIIVRNLKEIGIDAKMIATDPAAVDAMVKSGDYQAMLSGAGGGGCYAAIGVGGPIASWRISNGKDWAPNTARYKNPATDKLIKELQVATDKKVVDQKTSELTKTYLEDFPYVTLVYAPIRIIYRMDRAVGWPSTENPYATGADLPIMLTHLRAPAGS